MATGLYKGKCVGEQLISVLYSNKYTNLWHKVIIKPFYINLHHFKKK